MSSAKLKFWLLTTVVATSIFDGHIIADLLISSFLLFVSYSQVYRLDRQTRSEGCEVWLLVSLVYIASAFIVSIGYRDPTNKVFIDVYSYTRHLTMKQMDLGVTDMIIAGFIDLEDWNVLHELGHRYLIIFCNNHLDGASVYNLTLSHTAFGIISINILFKILSRKFDATKAKKYTLYFAFLSPFFTYSVVIMRDIIIACIYIYIIDLILKEFKYVNVLRILTVIVLCVGIRLYSGLFALVFLVFYIYKKISSSKYSKISLIVVGLAFVIIAGQHIVGSDIFRQSSDELTSYVEYDADRSSGFSSKLVSLPMGFKEIAMSLYSQVHPFPFYDMIRLAKNASIFYLTIIKSISTLWWYYVFFGFIYALFIKKYIKRLSFTQLFLTGIIFLYIILNSVQIDVRRIMAIYPLIYLMYLQIYELYYSPSVLRQVNNNLTLVYSFMLLIYLVIIAR